MKTRSENLLTRSSTEKRKQVKGNPIESRNKQQNRINVMKTRSFNRLIRNQAKTTISVDEASKNKPPHSNEKSFSVQIDADKERDQIRTRSKTLTQNEMKTVPNQIELNKVKPPASKLNGKKVENRNQRLMEYGDYRVFVVGDLVWAKLKGWPAWPAKITKIIHFQPFKVEVLFYNDGRAAVLFASQLEHLLFGFESKQNAEKVRKSAAVHEAAKEAMIAYFFSNNLHHQFIPSFK